MKLNPDCILKKGDLIKSPPLDAKVRKRWMDRYFVLYDPSQIKNEEKEGEDEDDMKIIEKRKKQKRRGSSLVNIFGSGPKVIVKPPKVLTLIYYENEEKEKNGSQPLNKIALTGATANENLNNVNGHKFAIELQTQERKFYLCAATKEEHDSWLEKLKDTIASSQDVRRDSIDSMLQNESHIDHQLISDGRLQAELDILKQERTEEFKLRGNNSQSELNPIEQFPTTYNSRSDSGISGDQEDDPFHTNSNPNSSNSTSRVSSSSSNYSNSRTSEYVNFTPTETSTGYVNVNRQTGELLCSNSEHHKSAINPTESTDLSTEDSDPYHNIDDFYPNPSTSGYVSPPPPKPLDDNEEHDYQHPTACYDDKTNTDEVYDVPPNNAVNEGDSLTYDVPPTFSNKSQLYNPSNGKITDIQQEGMEIYDTPPNASDEIYDTPPNASDEIYDTPPSVLDELYDCPSKCGSDGYVNFEQFKGQHAGLNTPPPARPPKPADLKFNVQNEETEIYDVPPPQIYSSPKSSKKNIYHQDDIYDTPPSNTEVSHIPQNPSHEIYDCPSKVYSSPNRPPKPTDINISQQQDDIYDCPTAHTNLPSRSFRPNSIKTDKNNNNNNNNHNLPPWELEQDIYDNPLLKPNGLSSKFQSNYDEELAGEYSRLEVSSPQQPQRQQQLHPKQPMSLEEIIEIRQRISAEQQYDQSTKPTPYQTPAGLSYSEVPLPCTPDEFALPQARDLSISDTAHEHNELQPPAIPERISSFPKNKRSLSNQKYSSLPTFYDTSFDSVSTDAGGYVRPSTLSSEVAIDDYEQMHAAENITYQNQEVVSPQQDNQNINGEKPRKSYYEFQKTRFKREAPKEY